ncbi:hypothetical protein ACROYT_G001261 [Oculina patagonica]
MIEPYDEVIMADRGFKIREDLMMHMTTLCIPPSCASSMQLLPRDVKETSNIANVRIYVAQAIGLLKVFLLLKNELPITLLPLHILLSYFKTLSVGPVWGSNPRPPAQQSSALPTELTRRLFGEAVGLDWNEAPDNEDEDSADRQEGTEVQTVFKTHGKLFTLYTNQTPLKIIYSPKSKPPPQIER